MCVWATSTSTQHCCMHDIDIAFAVLPDQELERDLQRRQHDLESEREKLQALIAERGHLQAAKCGTLLTCSP